MGPFQDRTKSAAMPGSMILRCASPKTVFGKIDGYNKGLTQVGSLMSGSRYVAARHTQIRQVSVAERVKFGYCASVHLTAIKSYFDNLEHRCDTVSHVDRR
jgi:hypothetical protein